MMNAEGIGFQQETRSAQAGVAERAASQSPNRPPGAYVETTIAPCVAGSWPAHPIGQFVQNSFPFVHRTYDSFLFARYLTGATWTNTVQVISFFENTCSRSQQGVADMGRQGFGFGNGASQPLGRLVTS
jgi:hypothetical protein